jgi:dihydrofolate reductase
MNKNIPRFNVIIATDSTGGFSYNNKLPWKFIKDTNFYNTITSTNINGASNILIMGRKTWESMNCIVPKNRIAFVISSDYVKFNNKYEALERKNLYFFPSFLDALSNINKFKDSIVWAIGGYQIYHEALSHENCASIYCTSIVGSFETDRKIDLKTYNVNWVNIHQEIDKNLNDKLNYVLNFKRGFINRY